MSWRRKRTPESKVIYINPSPSATHLVTTAMPCDYTMVIQRALLEVNEEDDYWNGAVFPPGVKPSFNYKGELNVAPFDSSYHRALGWLAWKDARYLCYQKQCRLRSDVEEFLQSVAMQDIEKRAFAANVEIKKKLLAEQKRQTTITKGAC